MLGWSFGSFGALLVGSVASGLVAKQVGEIDSRGNVWQSIATRGMVMTQRKRSPMILFMHDPDNLNLSTKPHLSPFPAISP